MGYRFDYAYPDAMEGAFLGAAGVFTGIFLIVYLLMMAFSLLSYVLSAVGMYRIAKRRGIHHAWLAWIPVGSTWLLGSISDHYQYVAKQKVTNRRTILLVLYFAMLAMTVLIGVATALMAAQSYNNETSEAILALAVMAICALAILGLSIAVVVFAYMAYYDLFQSCRPNSAVLFLVLGIFFNVTMPFFVFACSSTDYGMPARRVPQPPAQIPYYQP